jgi:hypothetical protein
MDLLAKPAGSVENEPIAEVGHLVLLWAHKAAALPANDVVSAAAA